MRTKFIYLLCIIYMALLFVGCAKNVDIKIENTIEIETTTESEIEEESLIETEMVLSESTEQTEETVDIFIEETTECETTIEGVKCVVLESEEMESGESSIEETQSREDSTQPSAPSNGHLIVIDPGHQQKGNSEKEPVGPAQVR